MELHYGQRLELKKDISLAFVCNGILPAGQLGYQETHYKIQFDRAEIVLPASLVSELFEEYIVKEPVKEVVDPIVEVAEVESESVTDLSKLKKDELISLVQVAKPDLDVTGLKKDDLINIIEAAPSA
jgi:hypothetical protein